MGIIYFRKKVIFSTFILFQSCLVFLDCSVVYVWALIRHGTRYTNEDDELTSEILKSVRDEIVQNHKKHNREFIFRNNYNIVGTSSYYSCLDFKFGIYKHKTKSVHLEMLVVQDFKFFENFKRFIFCRVF